MKKVVFIWMLVLIFFILNACTKGIETNNKTINITNLNKTISHIEYNMLNNNSKNNTINKTSAYNNNLTSENIKLIPYNNKIYFGAFPDFGGTEDNVTKKRIIGFQKLVNKSIAWAYFSQNWFNGIVYPKKEIHLIHNLNITPFVRLMPRSSADEYVVEKKFTLDNIINGVFDSELNNWALDAKQDNIPLLVDFGVEMNGDWFSWSGYYNGAGVKKKYGDPDYFDGPEKYRDAYRHIIDIFNKNNVTHITWFFHVDINSEPDVEWNQPKYYYPGDNYIDWIGVSIYGALTHKDDWISFKELLESRADTILSITHNKPFALLEFGVTDDYKNKSKWLSDAFKTILNRSPLNFSAVSYWNENWEEENRVFARLRVDSSNSSLNTFKQYIDNDIFVSHTVFSNKKDCKAKSAVLRPGMKWFWQLTEPIKDVNVSVYDIDLFEYSSERIRALHDKNITVVCYFNAGAFEPYRPDSEMFSKEVIGKILEGWSDEFWLDVRSNTVKNIMLKRLDLAKEKGCDGVEPDNVDAYANPNGFSLSYKDQLNYNAWLCEEAHKRSLLIGLKNDLDQVNDLVDCFDFAVNEECFFYDECNKLIPFIKRNKPVFGVEYNLDKSDFCNKAKSMNFSWFLAGKELNGEIDFC